MWTRAHRQCRTSSLWNAKSDDDIWYVEFKSLTRVHHSAMQMITITIKKKNLKLVHSGVMVHMYDVYVYGSIFDSIMHRSFKGLEYPELVPFAAVW